MAPEFKAYYNTGKSAIYGNDEGEVGEYKGVLQNPEPIPYIGNLLTAPNLPNLLSKYLFAYMSLLNTYPAFYTFHHKQHQHILVVK